MPPAQDEVAEPGFVTRAPELAWLKTRLQQAMLARGQLCMIAGAAGTGKSTLLAEFERLSQETFGDLLIVSGMCDSQQGGSSRRSVR